MTDNSLSLPTTLEESHALIKTQTATIDQQQEVIDQQKELLSELKRDLDLLKRSMFGKRRERFEDPDQQLLFESQVLANDSEAEKDSEPENPGATDDNDDDSNDNRGGSPKRGRSHRVFPEFLPREQRFRKLEDSDIPADLQDADGRRFMKKVGEFVEYKPPELRVIEEFVETLAVDNEDETETTMVSASREPRILQSFAGPSLLASLAVNRFADHLPYYRLEEILDRIGLSIDRATQSRWMISLAQELLPLVALMRKLVLQSPIVQADETPVKMLVPGQGHASTAYLWAVLGDQQRPYSTFYFTEDRSRAGPDRFFAGFDGVLLSDAYIGYESLGAQSQDIDLAGCHVHARRKFEALHVLGATKQTSTAMGYFQRLFDLEDELKPLSDEERHAQRQRRAFPLMSEFKTWLDDQLTSLRPKHELRSTIEYMTKRWDSFTRFLDSGAIPIHNNASEQAVKLPVMGKKAWLFFGAPSGGETAAIFFSLTATCRRLQIDPEAYLRDVFERIPYCDGTEASLTPLLPDRWLAAHPESKLQRREQESSSKAARKRALRARRRKALAKKNRP